MFAEIRLGNLHANAWLLVGLGLLLAVLAGLMVMGGVPLVLLGVAGVGAVLLFLIAPQLATLLGAFLLYSNLSVLASLSGVPTQLAGGLVLALLALPFFHSTIFRHERAVVTPIMFIMLLYFAMLLFSMAFSEYPNRSTTRVSNYITEGLLLYFLTVNAIRSIATLRRVIWVLLVAGSVMAGFSVYQGITQNYDNDFGGFAQVTQAEIAVSDAEDAPTVMRLAGPIGEKNRYAQVLVVLLPLAITRLLAERRLELRIAALVAFGLILGGSLFTFSRGASVALVVMFLAMLPLRLAKGRHLLATALIFIVMSMSVVPGAFYRLSTIQGITGLFGGDPAQADSSLRGRATENIATWRIFLDHPITGIGPGQTPTVMREYARGVGFRLLDPNRRAHNLYLEELADTGILGFVPFVTVIVVTVAGLWRVGRQRGEHQPEKYYVAAGLVLSILMYLVTAVFLHLAYERYYWFLMAVAGAATVVYDQQRSAVKQPARSVPVLDTASSASAD